MAFGRPDTDSLFALSIVPTLAALNLRAIWVDRNVRAGPLVMVH
jgi:hypothetical protein